MQMRSFFYAPDINTKYFALLNFNIIFALNTFN